MKKQLSLLLMSSLILTGCDSMKDYTSFKEYTEIVKNAKQNQKDIFFFTASNCSSCQAIAPLLEKFISQSENEDYNVYVLSVDYKIKLDGTTVFKDETMGYLTGNSENDCIKRLDNRIALYVSRLGIIPSNEGLISISSSTKYSYTVTPLILFYQGNIEVKIINNVVKNIKQDDSGKLQYDSFLELMEYPEEKPVWNNEFNLTPYVKETKTTSK